MKKIIIAFFLLSSLLIPSNLISAKEDYGALYISIGEAIMHTKAYSWPDVESAMKKFKEDWSVATKKNSPEKQDVDQALQEAENTLPEHKKQIMLEKLSALSNALLAFDKLMNPVDEEAQRKEVETALKPVFQTLEDAITAKDQEEVNMAYKLLLSAWNKKESIVREQSIDYYGQFESTMGLLRIAIAKDPIDFEDVNLYFIELSATLNDFISGKEAIKSENGNHSLQSLINLLDIALKNLNNGQHEVAVKSLQEFLMTWPAVEGEIQTRNGTLYKQLENNIPIIAGKLSSTDPDLEALKSQLEQYKQEISLLQKKEYSIWDAALIMLREGLEALLIVSALIAFLKKTNNNRFEKWIWLGAIAGVILSVVTAIIMNSIFSTALAGTNREILEGVTGIIAVMMMIGVGIWLHQKSNLNAWNQYIKKQMGQALSKESVVAMAFISFLSIFREGAETIIFYSGMAPSISTEKLIMGIGIAVCILLLFTIFFIKYSTRMPITPFFKVATILIYVLAFKILGVSIHALQLTNVLSTTLIKPLPIIDFIGFFPTWETIVPQSLLLLIVILVSEKIYRKNKQTSEIQA